MNARHALTAVAITAALTVTSAAHAGINHREFNFSFGNANGFNISFGGNNRNFFRQAERVIDSNRDFRREVNDLRFNDRFVLLQLSNQVNLRTNQIVIAVRNDNRRLVEVRARQLIQVINQIENIVDRLPRGNRDVRDVQRAFNELEDDVRDLLRTLR